MSPKEAQEAIRLKETRLCEIEDEMKISKNDKQKTSALKTEEVKILSEIIDLEADI